MSALATALTESTDSVNVQRRQAPPDYARVCRYITERYYDVYGASIECEYQDLLYVMNDEAQVVAACGMRSASQTLFLERYLTQPLEDTLSSVYGCPIERSSVVETGHLTASASGAAGLLMDGLWRTLKITGYDYLVLTCTRRLSHRFRGLPLHIIARATQDEAGHEYDWGSYYEQQPQVMSGKIDDYDHRFGCMGAGESLQLGRVRALT